MESSVAFCPVRTIWSSCTDRMDTDLRGIWAGSRDFAKLGSEELHGDGLTLTITGNRRRNTGHRPVIPGNPLDLPKKSWQLLSEAGSGPSNKQSRTELLRLPRKSRFETEVLLSLCLSCLHRPSLSLFL